MIRVNILVEGYTESFFIRDNLSHALSPLGIYLTPILFKTSKQGRGGITTYKKIQNQVNLLCKKDTSAYVTTLLDYYGLPSDVAKFKDIVTDDENSLQQLIAIRNKFPSPEDINNSYETAPSKRLEKIFPDYNKVVDGNYIAETIGLDKIRQECHHFDAWVSKLCQLNAL